MLLIWEQIAHVLRGLARVFIHIRPLYRHPSAHAAESNPHL